MRYKITLNGKTYEVEVERGSAILLDEYEAAAPAAPVAAPAAPAPAAPAAAPAPAAPAGAGEAVTAPLPGTLVAVKVTGGQTVKAGDLLCVLEAMKMENEILAPRDGTVTALSAAKGAAVQAGDPLVVLA